MDTAHCIWTSVLAEGRDIFIDSYKNPSTKQELFLIRERTLECNYSDNTSINRFVISQAILQCLNLIYDDWTNESELYSVNTDGIHMTNPKYHMFGDTNECDPLENGSQIYHDYFKSVQISEMCPRRVEMKYKESCVPYDEQTRDVLTKSLETGKVTGKLAPRDHYYKNICYLNNTRQTVTRECCDRFVEDKESYEADFLYNSKRERYSVCVGMPMVVTQNLEYSKFNRCFIPAFCCTVYKYQGAEIDEHYDVYNVNRMDKNQLHTALSRTTKLEYIHLSNELLNKRYIPCQQPHIEILNSYFNSDYSNGKIYKIVFEKCDKICW